MWAQHQARRYERIYRHTEDRYVYLLSSRLTNANDRSWKIACKEALVEIDFFGLLLIAASLALILLPLGLAPKSQQGWQNPSMVSSTSVDECGANCEIGMIVVGMTLIPVFVWYEAHFPSKPVFPMRWLTRPAILGACLIGFCDFVSFYLQNTFLYS